MKKKLNQLCNPTDTGSKVPHFQRCGFVPVLGRKVDATLPDDPEVKTEQSLLLGITRGHGAVSSCRILWNPVVCKPNMIAFMAEPWLAS